MSHEFDTQVWGEVVIVALDNSEDVEKMKIVANTAYSYEVFRMAARRVFDRNSKWKDPHQKLPVFRQMDLGPHSACIFSA